MMEKSTKVDASQDLGKGEEQKDYAMEAAQLEAQQKRVPQGVPGTHEPFPVQLHWVLEQTEKDGLSHIVRWSPHGRAFVVHNRDLFVKQVLPVYFNQSKFTSFQRQLSLYGFRRLSKGPDRAGYWHPMFLRISRTFARNISRTKVKNEGPRRAAMPESEPDFYKMRKLAWFIEQAAASAAKEGGRAHAFDPSIQRRSSATQNSLREPGHFRDIPVPAARTHSSYALDRRLTESGLALDHASELESRLAYAQRMGSPPLTSATLNPLQFPAELDHARWLAGHSTTSSLRRTGATAANSLVPSLQAQLSSRQSFVGASPWPLPGTSSLGRQGLLSNVPSLPDLLLQQSSIVHANTRPRSLVPPQRRHSSMLDAQAVAYLQQRRASNSNSNSYHSERRNSPPLPVLSNAIADMLNSSRTPPGWMGGTPER